MFSSSLVLSSGITMCLFVVFIVFVLLGIYLVSWIGKLMFCTFGKISTIILSQNCSFPIFSLLSWDLNYTYIHRSLTLCSCFKTYFLISFLQSQKCYESFSSSLTLSLVILNLLISQSSKFFITGIFFSAIEFPLFLLIISVFLLTFLLCLLIRTTLSLNYLTSF